MEIHCSIDDVPPGVAYKIEGDGHDPIAVYNVSGTIYATDDTCTHGEASLCDGELSGCIIECPFHFGTFDVTTGEAIGAPAYEPLRTYPVVVEDGVVTITIA